MLLSPWQGSAFLILGARAGVTSGCEFRHKARRTLSETSGQSPGLLSPGLPVPTFPKSGIQRRNFINNRFAGRNVGLSSYVALEGCIFTLCKYTRCATFGQIARTAAISSFTASPSRMPYHFRRSNPGAGGQSVRLRRAARLCHRRGERTGDHSHLYRSGRGRAPDHIGLALGAA